MTDLKTAKSKQARAAIFAVALSVLVIGQATGQEVPSIEVQVVDSSSQLSEAQRAAGPIEEVIVTGQRSMGALIRQGSELTENFYMRLNEVIGRDEFEINCVNEFPTGSRISTRVCRMRFQEELMSRQSATILQGLDAVEDEAIPVLNGGVFDPRPEMRRMMTEWEDAVVQAVNIDPVLNEQVIQLIALKSAVENFESPREQRRREREEERALEETD